MLCDSSDRFRALALHGEHHASPPTIYTYACTRAIAQISRATLTACTCIVHSRTFPVVVPESRDIERAIA